MAYQLPRPDVQKYLNKIEDKNILINVSGHHFETKRSILDKYPNTLLGSNRKESFYNKITKEYYFERDPIIFRYILNYYRTGRLHFPKNECVNNYDTELKFFGLTSEIIDECCYQYYQNNKKETLKYSKKEDNLVENIEKLENTKKLNRVIQKIEKSKLGITFYCITGIFIIIFVIANFARNEKCFEKNSKDQTLCLYPHSAEFFYLDILCVLSFTIEFSFRLFSAVNFSNFVFNILNIIDFISIIIYYNILFVFDDFDILRSIIMLRVFRLLDIFEVSKKNLNLLSRTLRESALQLIIFVSLLIVTIVIFATFIFYLEQDLVDTNFINLRDSTWFIAVSMTTLGYGDYIPRTIASQISSILATLSGVTIIALAMTTIISNFLRISQENQIAEKLKERKQLSMKIPNLTLEF